MVVLHQAGFSREFDARANSVPVAFDADSLKQNPMVVVGCEIVKQFGMISNAGYNHINLAVVIPVTKIYSHAGYRDPVLREGHEGFHSYFLEALAPTILE